MADEKPPPPDHFNRPYTYPRFPGISGSGQNGPLTDPFMVRRGPFLKGDRWCMFMPGQSIGLPFGYNGTTQRPADWPPEGAPLRVPKVLFLTSCPPAHLYTKKFVLVSKWARQARGYLPHYFDAEVRDTRNWSPAYRPPAEVPYGSLVYPAFYGGYEYIGWTCDPQYNKCEEGRRMIRRYTEVDNPIVAEHERLVDAFEQAKAVLESKYRGEVFVQICEFFPRYPVMGVAPNDELMPLVLDVYSDNGRAANTPKHFADGPTWMLGPEWVQYDRASDTCDVYAFGTDFAHIYCGYQSCDGSLGSQGFQARSRPNLYDIIRRLNFSRQTFGYPLDDQFWAGYDQFLVSLKPPGTFSDGYENEAYNLVKGYNYDRMIKNRIDPGMGKGGNDRVIPVGKLSMLQAGFRRFAGYYTGVYHYDLSFKFGSQPDFRPGTGPCKFPRGDTIYEDQDWVEQAIVMQYDQRQAEDPNPDGDHYYPGYHYDGYGGSGDEGHGGYNYFQRYPETAMYRNTWTPALHDQHNWLNQVLNGLGPKASRMFDDFIAEQSLGNLGFEHPGGSSMVDGEYIINWAENHWGLKENRWG